MLYLYQIFYHPLLRLNLVSEEEHCKIFGNIHTILSLHEGTCILGIIMEISHHCMYVYNSILRLFVLGLILIVLGFIYYLNMCGWESNTLLCFLLDLLCQFEELRSGDSHHVEALGELLLRWVGQINYNKHVPYSWKNLAVRQSARTTTKLKSTNISYSHNIIYVWWSCTEPPNL